MGGKWLAQRTIYRDSTDLVFVTEIGNELHVAQRVNFTMVVQPRHHAIEGPTLELYGDSGQSLMQALWDAGLRPNNGAGSGAEAVALKKHIEFAEDMARGLLTTRTSSAVKP